jgi:FAD/FMN-containing dehydrogenase
VNVHKVKWGRWFSLLLGLGAVVAGGLLIERSSGSTAGSPLGWILVAIGIFWSLGTLAIVSGASR